jgi:hypothetical protein
MKPSKEASKAAKIIYTKSLCNERLWCELSYAETIQEIVCAPLEHRIAELESVNKNVMDVNVAFRERIEELENKIRYLKCRLVEHEIEF